MFTPINFIRLNSRQIHINRVMVGTRGLAVEAYYLLSNYLEKPVVDGKTVTDPESFRTHLKAAYESSDDGELIIYIPKVIFEALSKVDSDDESGMVIRIEYELLNPTAGLFFVLPSSDSYPNRAPHMYSHNISGARTWMPCFDTTYDRCRWVLEFEVSSEMTVVASGVAPSQPQDIQHKESSKLNNRDKDKKKNATSLPDLNDLSLNTNQNNSSNNTTSSTTTSSSSSDVKLKKFVFVVTQPVLASSISFAVGKFETVSDAIIPNKITYFSLPGRTGLLTNTVGFMAQSVEYFEGLLHSQLPTNHLKLVFVDDCPTKIIAGAGIIICSTHLLHSQDVIDQVYSTRKALSVGLAMQWFPTLVSVQKPQDYWIVSGIVGYMAYLNYQKMFGQSEYKSSILSDLKYVMNGLRHWSIRSKRSFTNNPHPTQQYNYFQSFLAQFMASRYQGDPNPVDLSMTETFGDFPFINDIIINDFDHPLYHSNYISLDDIHTKSYYKKATLVMIQLEKMMTNEIFLHMLERFVRPTEETGLPSDQALTTSKFLKVCKKSSVTHDMKRFAKSWIYQPGIPHLKVGFQYHPRTQQTEIVFKQETQYCEVLSNTILVRIHDMTSIDPSLNPNSTSTSLTSSLGSVRSSNPDPSTPGSNTTPSLVPSSEDHEILLSEVFQSFSTRIKVKKTAATTRKKPTSKKSSSKMDVDETDEEYDDMDDDEDDYSTKRSKNTSNSSRNAVESLSFKPDLGWIRIDPELEWLRYISFNQPEYMWVNQLKHDRDVLAQLEGIEGLVTSASTVEGALALYNILTNQNNFFKVRMRAAVGLGVIATRVPQALGFLKNYFVKNYYETSGNGYTSSYTTSVVTTPGVSGSASSQVNTPSNAAQTPVSDYSTSLNEPPSLKPNDFSDLESYFVQKAVSQALASIKDERGQTPPEIFEFLIDLLNANDNSRNAYSDNYYVSSLLHALSFIQTENHSDYVEMTRQMERYLGKEKMMPCFHNVIAQSCLQLLAYLQETGKIEIDIEAFRPYLNYGNFPQVRAIALRCYVRLGIVVSQNETTHDAVFKLIAQTIRTDPSVWIKMKAAFYLASSLQCLSPTQLDSLNKQNKSNQWRHLLYELINSNDTAYYPRLRSLVILSLELIQGEKIANVPKLPPRIVHPTQPIKASQSHSQQSGSKKTATKKRNHDNITPAASSRSHQEAPTYATRSSTAAATPSTPVSSQTSKPSTTVSPPPTTQVEETATNNVAAKPIIETPTVATSAPPVSVAPASAAPVKKTTLTVKFGSKTSSTEVAVPKIDFPRIQIADASPAVERPTPAPTTQTASIVSAGGTKLTLKMPLKIAPKPTPTETDEGSPPSKRAKLS